METNVEGMRKDIESLKRAVEELKIAVDIEPEVRPEYVKKIRGIEKEKGNFISFNSIEELKESIENA